MSDIKVINIKDSSFKMWESDASGSEASGSVAGGAASDNDQDQYQDFDEKSENLFESSTMSGGSDDGFRADTSNELDLFEDNMSRASSFSDQSGGSKKNKSVSETRESESDNEKSGESESDNEKSGESELEDDESLLEELSRDPLMIVLGNFLISRKGNNIADILEDIRDHLGYIRHYLSEAKEM